MAGEEWTALADALAARRGCPGGVVLYPHEGMDGDALGTCLALRRALADADIPCRVAVAEAVPPRCRFLPDLDRLELHDRKHSGEWASFQALALAVDCHGPERLGPLAPLYRAAPIRCVLDHHVLPADGVLRDVDLAWVDPTAAAAGEMAFDLVLGLGERVGRDLLSPTTAACLMAALVADTGCFRFSNTTARTLAVASRLLRFPLDLNDMAYRLFDQMSRPRLRLLGEAFRDAEFHLEGRVAMALVSGALLDRCGAEEADVDGLANSLRDVEGVVLACVLREREPGLVRCNLRSREGFDASELARHFGGGGHRKAAGFSLHAGLEEARLQVLSAIRSPDGTGGPGSGDGTP